MTSTTATWKDKKAKRTDQGEFDRFTERDPSTRTSEEIERFHEMEDNVFGNVYPAEFEDPETWSPDSIFPGVDLEDLAQASEGSSMVAAAAGIFQRSRSHLKTC